MKHKDIIIDTDAKFEIDPVTRAINNASSSKTTVIQYDHNSERFGFALPRYIEGHDMMDCNRVEIHYKNTDNDSKEEAAGVYEVTDMGIDEEDETRVVFSWLVSQNATQRVGALTFLVRFSCTAEDGTVEYAWNTSIFKGIFVSSGMYNSGEILKQYADVLEQWKVELSKIAVPYVGNNGNWFKYDIVKDTYVDTGVKAEGVDGTNGTNGIDGKDGYTPQKGVDYWTESDKAEIIEKAAPFVVNFTVESDSRSVVASDKTAEQILEAYNNGKNLLAIANINGAQYQSTNVEIYENDFIHFIIALDRGSYVIWYDGTNPQWYFEDFYNYYESYVDGQIGSINAALDHIIAIQNQLMGVSE